MLLKKNYIKILLIAVIIFIALYYLFKERENNYESDLFLNTSSITIENTTISNNITVYITGEVNKPRRIYS